jgi:hypothetical protein
VPYFFMQKGGKGIDQITDHRPRVSRE